MYLRIVLLLLFVASQAKAFNYTITGSKKFRPDSGYKFIVTIYGEGSFSYHLEARIKEKRSGESIAEGNFASDSSKGTTEVFEFRVPRFVASGNYLFEIAASGDVTFSQSRNVNFVPKTHSVFIQTDKYLYKPGQTVLFRVLAIQPDLKPYTNAINTTIYDQSGNKIFELLTRNNQHGVVNGRLKLSTITPLGRWRIESVTDNLKYEAFFEVAEYVLPKFEVKVLSPSYFFYNSNNPSLQRPLVVTVTATYTFGKPVKGYALVAMKVKGVGRFTNEQEITKHVLLVDGKADITYSTHEIPQFQSVTRGLYIWYYHDLFIQANVTEAATGIILQGNKTMPVKTSRFELKFLESSSDNFRPGFLYTAQLKLSQVDGSEAKLIDMKYPNGTFRSLRLTLNYHGSSYYFGRLKNVTLPSPKNFDIPLTENGFVFFEIPIEHADGFNLEASFYDEEANNTVNAGKHVSEFETRDSKHIQLSAVGDPTIKPESTVLLNVKSTDSLSSFHFLLIGKGQIVYSEEKKSAVPSNDVTFSFNVDNNLALNLAPQANIVVYYVTSTGELVADSLSLPVVDYMANKVSLSISPETTAPGEEVVLKINASQDSFVSLSAIDQSVLLLSVGNDITQELLFKDLKKYTRNTGFDNDFMFWRLCRPIWTGGGASSELLENSGIFILTDFHISVFVLPYYFYEVEETEADISDVEDRIVLFSPGVENVVPPPKAGPSKAPRKNFPETWIWSEAHVRSDGILELKYKVPDTITSWVASAFATNSRFGLGITEHPAKVTVIKPFFINLNLPYSAIRGEQFALQVTVFNYFGEDLPVTVIMPKSNYYHVKECVQGSERSLQDSDAQKNIFVKNNDMVTLYFWIVPTSLGQIPIEVRAVTAVAADSLIANLLIKPEGQPQSYSSSSLIRLPSDDLSVINFDVSLPPPDILVPDSVTIEATLIGDILGTTINNLDNLLQMPYGCGEQNMVTLAPDVYIVKYLTATNQLTEAIKNKALGFINTGYQRQLTYQRDDGSFSAFGNSDATGSVWLSAFVIKVFRDARDVIPVEDDKIANTLRWILQHQREDGSFVEVGKVLHTAMQGGASSGLGLTAYVLISLLVNRDIKVEGLSNKIGLTISYLEGQYEAHQQDPYILSIIGYAFFLAGSPKLNDVLARLNNLAIQEHGVKYWHKEVVGEESTLTGWRPIYSQPQSNDVEMTSYVLLTYASQLLLIDSIPIAKWLISKRNPEGGFTSTQDTVLGLEALSIFGHLVVPPTNSEGLQVQVTQNVNEDVYRFTLVNRNSALLLQSHQILSEATSVTFSATGEGLALVQLNVRYYIKSETENTFIKQSLETTSTDTILNLKVYASWVGLEETGMVLIEVYLLTGYTLAGDYADVLKNEIGSIFKKEEFSNNRLSIYLDELKEISFTVKMKSIYYVKEVKPALVKSYRYYSPGVSVSGYYSPTSTSATMDVCDPIFNQQDSNVANDV